MSTTTDEVVDGEVVNDMAVIPYTGEALTLRDLSFAQLGQVLDAARVWERSQLAGFKQDVEQEILRRMDARAAEGEEGAWTVRERIDQVQYTLSGDSPDRTEYKVDELRGVLEQLVKDGKIAKEAIEKVIVPERYKVAKRPLAQLMKVSPEVKQAILAVERPVERPRHVQVKLEVVR